MPSSHRSLSNWYRQLAQQLEAGLPFAAALRLSRGAGARTEHLDAMAVRVEAGGSIDDALRLAQKWLPLADLLALSAAAEAGRIPQTLRQLSERHRQLASAQLKIVIACVYPTAVLHLGLLLLPVTRMIDWEKGFHWDTATYLRGLAFTLLPLWALIVTLVVLVRRDSPLPRRLATLLPLVSGYQRRQALADLAFALANALEAGIGIGRAWALAGLTSRSARLKAAAEAMAAHCEAGAAPGRKLAEWPCFSPEFVALYVNGEQTGQLDANLRLLTTQTQEAAALALGRVAVVYPALLLLTVAGTVVYHVVTIMARYFALLGKLAE